MREMKLFAALVLLLCTPAVVAQSAPPTPEQQQKRKLAVNIVRAINTAELNYRMKHNRFATIEELRAAGAFPKADNNSPAMAALAAFVGPDIGGFYLRLFVAPGGSQFNLSLHDERDKSLWSGFSDDKLLIYTGTVIQ